MKLRTLVIAIVLLAALSGVVAFLNRPAAAPAADARVGQPLAAANVVEKAAGFRLTDAGKTVELKKSAAGAWLVTSYYDFPADFEKLSRFASDLTEAKLDRLVSTNPTTLARLGFADTRIQLLDPAGQPLLDLFLGKTPDTGGRFVRYGTEDKAYLARLDTFLDLEPKNWADSTLLQLKPDDIAKFELSFPPVGQEPAVTISATRAKKEDAFSTEHAPAGQQLRATAVSTILGNLGALHYSDTAVSDDANAIAAKAASRTVKFTTFDNKTISFALGRKPEEKKPKPPAPKPDPAKPADASAGVAATPPPSVAATDATDKSGEAKPADASTPEKPAEPEFDVIPAGPVFVSITHSDATAPVNALMAKRAFQIADYILTALPQTPADLFEPLPAPPAPATPAGMPAIPIPSLSPATKETAPAAPAK